MRLGAEEDFHIPNIEAELRDALHYQRWRSGVASIDEDMSVRPRDQERGNVICADVIKIAGDSERLGVLLSAVDASLAPLEKSIHSHGRDQCKEKQQPASAPCHDPLTAIVSILSPLF